MTTPPAEPRVLTVVVFGDSITAAKEVTDLAGHIFAAALSRGDDVRFVNASVAGRPAAIGAQRVESEVLAHRPDLVIVQFGFNDQRHDSVSGRCGKPISTPAEFAGHLQRIVAQIRAGGDAKVLIIGNHRPDSILILPTGKSYAETSQLYKAAARQVALDLGVHYLDMEAVFAASPHPHTAFVSDTVHLSAKGHWYYAMALVNKVQAILYDHAPAP